MFDIINRIKFKLLGKKIAATTETVYGKPLGNNSSVSQIQDILERMKKGKNLTIGDINILLQHYFKLKDSVISETYKLNTNLSPFALFELKKFDFELDRGNVESLYFILNETFLNMEITVKIKEKDFFELFEPVVGDIKDN